MSAPTPNRGAYGKNALHALAAAEAELKVMPEGNVATDVMQAHAAKAQVFINAAVAHALLEIGDVLRAALNTTTEETSADG